MALKREAQDPPSGARAWLATHAAGVICLAVGLCAIAVTSVVHLGAGRALSDTPDPWLTTPFLILSIIAATVAFVRREGVYILVFMGVSLAVGAMVLGWALALGGVVLVAWLAILILPEIM